jgi:hypothetical protein
MAVEIKKQARYAEPATLQKSGQLRNIVRLFVSSWGGCPCGGSSGGGGGGTTCVGGSAGTGGCTGGADGIVG